MQSGLSDDIAAIEARLEANADELEAEGIYVARAPERGADAGPQPVNQRPVAQEEDAAGSTQEVDVDEEASPAPGPRASDDEPASERAERPREKSRRGYWSRWLAKRTREKDEADRCQRICDLAEATCELADRICELAQRHPDEVRYDEACDRAEHQCRVAAEACTVCAG